MATHLAHSSPSASSSSSLLSSSPKETNILDKRKDEATGRTVVNQYVILEELGRGQHGKVRLAQDQTDGSYWAIKIINRKAKKKLAAFSSSSKPSPASAQDVKEDKLRKEIAILKKLRHDNVVRLREVIDAKSNKYIFLVFEYMKGGEVKWRTPDDQPILTVQQARATFIDILLGLEYLHHQGIIHRDIKPANLLWSANHSTVKISDFGVSHYSSVLQRASAGEDDETSRLPREEGILSPVTAGEAYTMLDEEALAKTAGSPAFFAPELCYGGDTTPIATTPINSPPATDEHPWGGSGGSSFFTRLGSGRPSISSRPSAVSTRPGSRPTSSSSSSFHRPTPSPLLSPTTQSQSPRVARPKITKAIDVWALGVTLYCLLFGKVPFEAHSEFALFGVIPNDDYQVPDVAGSDHVRTGGRSWEGEGVRPEEKELGDLLDKLLEKDPEKRIRLEEVKRHPWVLRGVDNARDWLTLTDPNNDTFVSVTRDEVDKALTETLSAKLKRTVTKIKQKLFRSGSSTSVRSRADSLSPRSSGAQSATLSSKHSFLSSLRNKDKDKDAVSQQPTPPLNRSASLSSSIASGSYSKRPSRGSSYLRPTTYLDPTSDGFGGPGWRLDSSGWRQESHTSANSGSTATVGSTPLGQPEEWISETPPSSSAPATSGLVSPPVRATPSPEPPAFSSGAPSPHLLQLPSSSATRTRSPLGTRSPALIPRRLDKDAFEDANEDAGSGDGCECCDEDDEDEGLELAFGKDKKKGREQEGKLLAVPPL